ncbi:MAG: hypothetical protein WC178_04860 [Candidatus Paceibacterota bacterium]
MKKIINYKKGESGEIILFVIFVVLFLVMFVSLFLSRMLARQAKTAASVANSVKSYYVADTGAENVLYFLATTEGDSEDILRPGMEIALDSSLFDDLSSCSARVSDPGTSTLKIDIIGTRNKISRAIQLFW